MFCGNKLENNPHKNRKGNGQGCVYKRGQTYTARITAGWKIGEDGRKIQLRKDKGGFATKAEALDYIRDLKTNAKNKKAQTLQQIWERWSRQKEPHIDSVTMAGYRAAFKHYGRISMHAVDRITVNMLQECIDTCRCGRRTRELMKTTATQLFDYAIDDDQIEKNPARKINLRENDKKSRTAITEEELEIIRRSFGTEPYAKYVYALCYLGFRPTEFLTLTRDSFHFEDGTAWFVSGIKTEAGRDRPVTIPPKILPIVQERLQYDSEYLFPRQLKTGGWARMNEAYFREHVFKPMMARLGIEGRVPYSARHTYADKIKKVRGADRDKASLIGHSDYETTKRFYQSTSLEDRKVITDQL